ncbi:MAG TPA: UDP-N-acetylmuramoyl-L-alanyl-D-glutamate--2,6-diaminopimelate ligase [Bacteroidetes bacterium]|nr:UDP-N-acetylmuramoyl-L-alanyl-D-glutamate--2,6-diaminopimelate ligase [Bacteroidota bacterium]
MKKLLEILNDTNPKEIIGSKELMISRVIFDSRKTEKDSLFVAVKGTETDGHKYIQNAIAAGAKAIICEALPEVLADGVTYIKVSDSAEALGWAASNFYGRPSGKLKLVGITGTNGKTTVATLLHGLFTALGYKAGLISTIENKVNKRSIDTSHTTPDAESINLLIQQMVEAGCDYAFMEVSSHAVSQRRIAGLFFAGGVFTNITHEHLDYHKTFKAYIEAKKTFFDRLPKSAFALVNADDKRGAVMLQNTAAKKQTFALRKPADFKAKILENYLTGLHLDLAGHDFHARLIGDFNAYNLLSVYATAMLLGQDNQEVMAELSNLKAPEGRFDYVKNQERDVIGIVDYAHTPDALEKVLNTVYNLRKGGGQIITVTGCGGDRDRRKRPLMAKVACNYSDLVVFTSDNPRSEDPAEIIAEMEKGIPPYAAKKVLSITDRLQAIKTACRMAQKGDIILVAGKGHEKYQKIKGEMIPFDDKKILMENL